MKFFPKLQNIKDSTFSSDKTMISPKYHELGKSVPSK